MRGYLLGVKGRDGRMHAEAFTDAGLEVGECTRGGVGDYGVGIGWGVLGGESVDFGAESVESMWAC